MEKTEKGQIIYEEYEDGSKAYISQFEEDCGFKYESNQVQ